MRGQKLKSPIESEEAEIEQDHRIMDGAVEDGTDPLQDGADLWYCMACGDAFPRLDIAPLYTDQHGLTYCRECLEPLFLPIADGDETGGLPRVGDDILSDVPGVMEGIDPELRERFLAGLVRSPKIPARSRRLR